MAVSVFVVLQARQAEIEAGLGYIEAVRDYWDSRAQLERAAGGSLPSMVTATVMPSASDSLPPIDLLRDSRFVTAADTAPPAPGDTGMSGMRMAPGTNMAPGVKMAPGQTMAPGMKMEPGAKMAPGVKMDAGSKAPQKKKAQPPNGGKGATAAKAKPPVKKAPEPAKKMDPAMKMPGMKMPERL